MGRNFTNVLALIDSPEDPDFCFRAAIGVANRFGSNLHVIYRSEMDETDRLAGQVGYENIKVWALQHTYRPMLDRRLSFYIHIIQAHTRKIVLGYVGRNKIDLIVIWEKRDSILSFLAACVYANLLSRKTGCPVLSMHRQAGVMTWKNIVLPVQESIPAGKLMLAVRLAGICKAKIHLVRVVNKGGDCSDGGFFLKACQLLQYHRSIEVECKMLAGMSPGGTIVKYSAMVNADLLLVCTGKQRLICGCLTLLLSTRRSAVSRLSVLTIPVEQLNIL